MQERCWKWALTSNPAIELNMEECTYPRVMLQLVKTGDELIYLSREVIYAAHEWISNKTSRNRTRLEDALAAISLRDFDADRYAEIGMNQIGFVNKDDPDATYSFYVKDTEFALAYRVLKEWEGAVVSTTTSGDFPHKCPKCGQSCYIGFLKVEHKPGMVCGKVQKDLDDIPF